MLWRLLDAKSGRKKNEKMTNGDRYESNPQCQVMCYLSQPAEPAQCRGVTSFSFLSLFIKENL